MRLRTILAHTVALLVMAADFPASAWPQATIATGSIQGVVIDPSGAVIPDATVTITQRATGQTTMRTTSAAGAYNSGPLMPGEYTVSVSAPGFSTSNMPIVVQVGTASNGSIALKPGAAETVIDVAGTLAPINTEQATVDTVMTTQQIERLPIGGRNFLDLAQLAPGVQIQDAGNFMPTKEGFASVSFQGRFGQAARIELDGIDVSDETFGTTTQNIPALGIQEFQVSQSSLDPSSEISSTGTINVVTKSGTNVWHGEAFLLARSHLTSARISDRDRFWRREQWGTSLGGPIIRNKLFLFAGYERPKQDLFFPVALATPFDSLSGGYNTPFREHMVMGRLDWRIKPNWLAFYRFSWDQLNLITAAPNTYQAFKNSTRTPVQAVGLDFATGPLTHSIRFGYTRFWDSVTDATAGSNIVNPAPDVSLVIGFSPNCVPGAPVFFCSGPSLVAPQFAAQRNFQFKYDGSRVIGAHVIRYGATYNRIRSLVVAALGGTEPIVLSPLLPFTIAAANTGPFPGGSANPANYPLSFVIMGNRAGFFTEKPRFGHPGGGVDDDRLEWYFADSWKIRRNFTLNAALRYVRDTGRTDSDLPPIAILDEFGPGLGARVNQPNKNFAPQLGIAWDPWGNGRTSIRAGAGMFYENTLHSNVVFDRSMRLPKGVLQGVAVFCPGDLRLPDGSIAAGSGALCGQPIGAVASQVLALQDKVAQQTLALGPQNNPQYIGNTLSNSGSLFAPNFKTPFSWQFNGGVQRQLWRGAVLELDYLRNVGLHYLLGSDTNHVGDSRYFNRAAALNAIAKTNAAFGCASDPSGIDCAIAAGAAIEDYASNGLDSSRSLFGGSPSVLFGIPPDQGAAFPGINPKVGENVMLFSQGRSVYNGLHVTYRQNGRFWRINSNVQFTYALGRFDSQVVNQDFSPGARDYRDPLRYTGPSALDRTHQISAGAFFQAPHGLLVSLIAHVGSPRPATLFLPSTGAAGEIFRTDITGDGTTGDVIPGSNQGSFGRGISLEDLPGFISNYNATAGSHLTPAGQVLVDAGLFTAAQLKALGAVTPTIAAPPAGQVGLDWLTTFDLRLGWSFRPLRRFERVRIEPTVSIYNLFNNANFDGPSGTISGVLNGLPGSLNGTTAAERTKRITFGSGTFAYGAPRQFEWGLRFVF